MTHNRRQAFFDRPPGDIPYRWFWGLGGVTLILCVISAFQQNLFLSLVQGVSGALIIALGFVERRRGAPPI